MLRTGNASPLLIMACLVLACSATTTPRIHANDAMARADADPVRFFKDYQSRKIVVMGHVGAKQLAQRARSSVSLVDYGPFIMGDVKPTSEAVPVIVFEPARRVLCYFAPSELDAVAEVQIGQRVFAECRGAQLANAPAGPLVQFGGCRLISSQP